VRNDIAVRVLWLDEPAQRCWFCGDDSGRYALVRAYNDGFRLDALSVLICPACYGIMAGALVAGAEA